MTCPAPTGSPAATDSCATTPPCGARTSFSIFIASTMQSTCPVSTVSPSATATESTVPCIGETIASSPPAPPAAHALLPSACKLSPRLLRLEHAHLEPAAVDLDSA